MMDFLCLWKALKHNTTFADIWEEVAYIKQALVSKLVIWTKWSTHMKILLCLSGTVTVSLWTNGTGAAILHVEETYWVLFYFFRKKSLCKNYVLDWNFLCLAIVQERKF